MSADKEKKDGLGGSFKDGLLKSAALSGPVLPEYVEMDTQPQNTDQPEEDQPEEDWASLGEKFNFTSFSGIRNIIKHPKDAVEYFVCRP